MSVQGELWEEVETAGSRARAYRDAPATRTKAPKRDCRECGRPIGRRWMDGQLCGRCKKMLDEGGEITPRSELPAVCGLLGGERRPCCIDDELGCRAIPF